MADKKTMTPEEKALLQAKHRLEAVRARNREKERNARKHRRLIPGRCGTGIRCSGSQGNEKRDREAELRHFLSFHLQKHD